MFEDFVARLGRPSLRTLVFVDAIVFRGPSEAVLPLFPGFGLVPGGCFAVIYRVVIGLGGFVAAVYIVLIGLRGCCAASYKGVIGPGALLPLFTGC